MDYYRLFSRMVEDGIQDETRNFLVILAHLKDFLKNSKRVVLLDVGSTFVAFTK